MHAVCSGLNSQFADVIQANNAAVQTCSVSRNRVFQRLQRTMTEWLPSAEDWELLELDMGQIRQFLQGAFPRIGEGWDVGQVELFTMESCISCRVLLDCLVLVLYANLDFVSSEHRACLSSTVIAFCPPSFQSLWLQTMSSKCCSRDLRPVADCYKFVLLLLKDTTLASFDILLRCKYFLLWLIHLAPQNAGTVPETCSRCAKPSMNIYSVVYRKFAHSGKR